MTTPAAKTVNISAPEFVYDPGDPAGMRSGLARLGPALGMTSTGISVYELPPGQNVCPYHFECGEEEWLLVLDGRPTLRTPAGEQQLEPNDVAAFPKGPDGAHAIRNDTGDTVRVLMFSERRELTATVYPDSNKVGMWTGWKEFDTMVHRESAVDYFSGEAGVPRDTPGDRQTSHELPTD